MCIRDSHRPGQPELLRPAGHPGKRPLPGGAGRGGDPVSYTHLDVYKRQQFTQEEIQDAADVVLRRFKYGFSGCTMTKLQYVDARCV